MSIVPVPGLGSNPNISSFGGIIGARSGVDPKLGDTAADRNRVALVRGNPQPNGPDGIVDGFSVDRAVFRGVEEQPRSDGDPPLMPKWPWRQGLTTGFSLSWVDAPS